MNRIDLAKITGASYAGAPKDYTMMYISKKVEHLIENLNGHIGCLVFVEANIDVPLELKKKNIFVSCENPQFEYAKYATEIWRKQLQADKARGYERTEEGYFIGKNVSIGTNAYIEPGVLIGHDVRIGDNAVILAGSVIKHALIGNDFICNENAVIGAYGFTMAEDPDGNKIRIPSLGGVVIGDCVEVGAHDNISCGSAGDTVVEDYVKIDALVHIGHDAYLGKNTEITAECIIGGFVEAAEGSYIGLNSTIRNRIKLGKKCIVGMGSNVTKSIDANTTVIGNPAKPMKK